MIMQKCFFGLAGSLSTPHPERSGKVSGDASPTAQERDKKQQQLNKKLNRYNSLTDTKI